MPLTLSYSYTDHGPIAILGAAVKTLRDAWARTTSTVHLSLSFVTQVRAVSAARLVVISQKAVAGTSNYVSVNAFVSFAATSLISETYTASIRH